jgi:chemotaxis protein MotA
MDKSTLIGLTLAFGAVLGSVLIEGGSLAALLNVPAAVLVFGGTLGAAMMSFPFSAAISFPKYLMRCFFEPPISTEQIVETFVRLADKARREGLLALEAEASELDPFCRKGVLLVVDGSDSSLVREVLETEVSAMERRHKAGYALLEAMGGFAPTMGIIGTVMGLVNVLSKLEDPSELGHSIATAFIATLYGVGTANLIWLPLGHKLKEKSAEEVWLKEITIEGIMSVQAGDNPRMVREKLEAQLPAAQRASAKEAASPQAAVSHEALAPSGG